MVAALALASPCRSRAADPPDRSGNEGDPSPRSAKIGRPSALVEAGRRIYREGRGTAGEALKAVVQGDVQVDGTQVTCESCHRRSGMGTGEGGRLSPPVAGPLLFAPGQHRGRPAYTDASLARALRDGIDPVGRPLDPLMPRYDLGEEDLAAVTAYLRALGADPSPGASGTSLRFATVIATDAPADQRDAVTGILTAFFAEKNAQIRREADRTAMRRAPGEPLVPYRRWDLEIWEVSGPAGVWRAQIEARYQERPVFAILSGLVTGPWRPIHDFCEANGIPCLLPNTDLTPAAEGDHYGLYFSAGMRLEAEILASEIAAAGRTADVLQVVAEADPNAVGAAAAFEAAIGRRGGRVRSERVGAGSGAVARSLLAGSAAAVVLWTPAGVIGAPDAAGDAAVGSPEKAGAAGSPIYFSSTILGDTGETLPADLRSRARVVHRGRLPGDRDTALERFRFWARARDIAARSERLQSQTWFSCMALVDGAKHLGLYPSRDYLLDLLDHSPGLSAFLPGFPRGEMGPGQRFLVKGGYVIPVAGGDPVWIVP
jgi:hypothetical protein